MNLQKGQIIEHLEPPSTLLADQDRYFKEKYSVSPGLYFLFFSLLEHLLVNA